MKLKLSWAIKRNQIKIFSPALAFKDQPSVIGLQKKKKTVLFGIEHLFVFVFLFVWPFTGFINDDDESERGNICEVDEDHDDVENHDEDADADFDAKSKSGAVEERIFNQELNWYYWYYSWVFRHCV